MSQSTSNKNDSHPGPSQLSPIESLAATRNDGKKHLLLATVRHPNLPAKTVPVIIKALAKYEGVLSIRIVLTESATHFLAGQSSEQPTVASLLELPNVEAVYRDHDEWGPQSWRRGASILHIESVACSSLSWVFSTLSANTLAKVVNGMSDNLLTSVIRAWDTDSSIDMKKKLILVAPAMNSAMWRHPITAKQIRVLKEDWGVKEEPASGVGDSLSNIGWFKVITPISKTLACGDTGGAMASVDTICEEIEQSLGL
ncbi:flavoprotein [Thermothelomyces heterothallicus CBS 203.75]